MGFVCDGLGGGGFLQLLSATFVSVPHRLRYEWIRLVFAADDRPQLSSDVRRETVASEQFVPQ